MNVHSLRNHRANPTLPRLPALIGKARPYGHRHYLNPANGKGVTILGHRSRSGGWIAVEDGSTGFDSKVHIYLDRPSMFRGVEALLGG